MEIKQLDLSGINVRVFARNLATYIKHSDFLYIVDEFCHCPSYKSTFYDNN